MRPNKSNSVRKKFENEIVKVCLMIRERLNSRGKGLVLTHGTLHLGTLHFAILEGHVWASIEGERVL